MATPTAGELHAALLAIQQAAEAVRAYDPEPIEGIETAIRTHLDTIRRAENLPPEVSTRRERIIRQCATVNEVLSRAHQYPEQIMARAAVLDQIGALARMIRESFLGLPRN